MAGDPATRAIVIAELSRRLRNDAAGSKADASVTAQGDCVLAVLTADCAPVALVSREGIVGAVHAGWCGGSPTRNGD